MECVKLWEDEKNCSGCGACYSSCPKDAIIFVKDVYGNLYPEINKDKCIQCGLCVKVCGFKNIKCNPPSEKVYASVVKDSHLQEKSSSGGIFAAMARTVIKENGAVVGAVMELEPNVQVYHKLSLKLEDIVEFQGSKYAQSDSWKSYSDIKKHVKSGKLVLFSGTPCQVDAVKRITGNPDNLITVDLICHGVAPVKLFEDNICSLSKQFGKVTHFVFRGNRIKGAFCATFVARNRLVHLKSQFIPYYYTFLNGYTYRESCYHCPYATVERTGDITIGDYWGVKDYHATDIKKFNRDNWSCVLINTKKGEFFWQKTSDDLILIPSKIDYVLANNHQLTAPSSKPLKRDEFLEAYRNGGYRSFEQKYSQMWGGMWKYRIKMFLDAISNK